MKTEHNPHAELFWFVDFHFTAFAVGNFMGKKEKTSEETQREEKHPWNRAVSSIKDKEVKLSTPILQQIRRKR